MFGLTQDRLTEKRFRHSCTMDIRDGDIVYITGASGAGKTVLLKELEKKVPASQSINLARIELPGDRMVVECLDPDKDFLGCLQVLSVAGLSDVFRILNQPSNLSDGEKYRFRLAVALAAGKKYIFADEFCSNLDRITASVISCKVHTFAKRTGTIFVLASCHDDILLDLQPDALIVKEFPDTTQVIYREQRRQK
jgi:ABC-type ATPase with predicted acetyltransferase domain